MQRRAKGVRTPNFNLVGRAFGAGASGGGGFGGTLHFQASNDSAIGATTATANALQVFCCSYDVTSPTSVTGNGLTWYQLVPEFIVASDAYSIWVAQGASPTTAAMVLGGVSGAVRSLARFEVRNVFIGATALDAVVQSALGTVGFTATQTATFGSGLGDGNGVLGVWSNGWALDNQNWNDPIVDLTGFGGAGLYITQHWPGLGAANSVISNTISATRSSGGSGSGRVMGFEIKAKAA